MTKPLALDFTYSPMLASFGLPTRLGQRKFELGSALASIEAGSRVVTTATQRGMIREAFEGDTGWTMYVTAPSLLTAPRHLAANVMQHYWERELKIQWLSQFHKLDRVRFGALNLVVFDALFFDSPGARRDTFYEIINTRCNFPDLSVIVIGQNTSPLALASQLGMDSDFMVNFK